MAGEMSAPQSSGNEQRAGSRWILGPWQDMLLFVATPLLVLPLTLGAARFVSGEQILMLVVAFGALGHHLPGLMRSYGDRELFRRFRVRFVLIPLVLLPTCGFFFVDELVGMKLVVLTWGVWHFLMQTYGFARIYDAKIGSTDRWSRWLDWCLCVGWFGTAVLYSPRRVGEFLGMAYQAGLPTTWELPLEGVRSIWFGATLGVTAWSMGRLAWRGLQGLPVSGGKVLLLLLSFAFYWYCLVSLTNLVVGVAMFEIFHDVQYLAIVWTFNRRRVSSGASVGSLTRFLFRNSGALVGLYLGLVFAYGSLSLVADWVSTEGLRNLLFGVIATSSLLHFYYDGFIWKVREPGTRRSLGVSDSTTTAQGPVERPSWVQWRHWLSWVGLAALVAGLAVSENRRAADDLQRARAVVANVPGSVSARNELARTLIGSNRFDEAIAHADVAIRLEPDVSKSYTYRGVALVQLGRLAEGLDALVAAERRHARDAYLQYHLAMVKRRLGRPVEAIRHLELSRDIRPGNADVHFNLGVVRFHEAMRLGDRQGFSRSGAHFRDAVDRDPGHAFAVCMLGEVARQMGDAREALVHFRRSLAIDPALPDARHGLYLALRDQNQFDEANQALAGAIRQAVLQSSQDPRLVERALEWAEELRERSRRDDIDSWEILGLAQAVGGRWDEAIEAVDTALLLPTATGSRRRRLQEQRTGYTKRTVPEISDD